MNRLGLRDVYEEDKYVRAMVRWELDARKAEERLGCRNYSWRD